MKSLLRLFIVLGMVFVLLVILNYESVYSHKGIEAKKGKMDLTNWDFGRDGIIRLDGEWEVYEGRLLTPKDFKGIGNLKPLPTGYVKLTLSPIHNEEGFNLSPKGVRTYRLNITLKNTKDILGLKVENIKMSNRVFINSKLEGQSGNPAFKDKGYKPNTAPYSTYFAIDGNKLQIILQVANFDYPFQGYLYKLHLGLQEHISLVTTTKISLEMAVTICAFFFSIYYLSIYSMSKKDKSYLYWGINIITIMIALFVSGQMILVELLPRIPFYAFIKLKQLAYMLRILSLIGIVNQINKNIIRKNELKAVKIIGISYITVVLITSYSISVYIDSVIYIPMICFLIILTTRLATDIFKNKKEALDRKESTLFVHCMISIIINAINNQLYSFNLVYSRLIGSSALGFFMIYMAYILSNRYFLAYRNMESMADRLMQMDIIKDEFITKTSYELKAPLYGIVKISETIIRENRELLDNSDFNKIIMLRSMALRLSGIVNNTLDVTLLRNNQLKLSISFVDIMVCANIVVEGFKYITQKKDIEITNNIRESVMVKGDKNKIGQVLFNLINNAVENMDKGKIEINIKKQGSRVSISVEDTGFGISLEKIEKVFRPYEYEGSEERSFGLYISRQLVELMEGELYLDWTEVNVGSRFIFSLPYTDKKSNLESKISEIDNYNIKPLTGILEKENIAGERNTILIVEDEMENIMVALSILRNEDYNVLIASSKDDAMRKVAENNIDLVILDLIIPGASGIDICKEMRKVYTLIEMPILISTLKNTNYDLNLALRAGANDFITKPFEEKEMIARVKTLINLKKSMEEAVKNELAFLQAQIKPHFLYNSLTAIISFCYTDGERAAKLLTHFSKYLRFTFDMDNKAMYTILRKELEAVDAYVEIKKARLGEKIKIEYDIQPDMMDEKIPSLYIQPLVENAINHGLYEKEDGGTVSVSVRRIEGRVFIQVKDDGVGMTKEKLKELNSMDYNNSGVGLSNIRKRARRLNEADMIIHSIEGKGTTITIIFRYL
ncbi:ATP-binding protein [Clostridium cylindrosporum]|uniref:Stage 0 sporulation protein A homolog n=1 Tax=Clostridium cylindrosporum DSM 605 TaxID=1121307 RepID=A0A0J8D716_CLOCY|nr:ATP-binding protein [Clostridium cylindrosporum]KMT21860.1 response regulator receiver domain/histidine kinase/DNA gyrase B/HSP90-like ATPase [Clostridium cylindrosporum DSM 605]